MGVHVCVAFLKIFSTILKMFGETNLGWDVASFCSCCCLHTL